jgi:hypothetical protein
VEAMTYLVGTVGDFIYFLVYGRLVNLLVPQHIALYGYPFGANYSPWSSEPVINFVYGLAARVLDTVYVYNIFLIFAALLTLVVVFIFFRKYLRNNFVSVLLSIVFVLSPYFFYQGREHPQLFQVWLLVLFLISYLTDGKLIKKVVMGLLLGLLILTSNYLGYFALLFISLYLAVKSVFLLIRKKPALIKTEGINYLAAIVPALLVCTIFIPNYLKAYRESAPPTNTIILNRPFEDFVTFSSRPWYYVLPSVDNPFFGGITQGILTSAQNSGYFLFGNYFKSEHSASYLGWVNLILAVVGLLSIIKKVRAHADADESTYEKYIEILVLGVVALCFVLLSMPPFFTVNGLRIYLPSFILWKLFPMFRVLARLGVVVLLIELIFTGLGYMAVINWSSAKLAKIRLSLPQAYAGLAILPLFMFSLAEFFIPIKLTDVSTMPRVYQYIAAYTPENAVIAVYPYSETQNAFYWMGEYRRGLINPRFFVHQSPDFSSELFTKTLPSCIGINEARSLGVTHLIVFEGAIPVENRTAEMVFFNNSKFLKKIKEFDQIIELPNNNKLPRVFIKVEYASLNEQASIYKLSQTPDYTKAGADCAPLNFRN